MKKINSRLILACALLAFASTAQAITIYTYSGNNFTSIPRNDPDPAGTYTTDMGISGSFSVNSPLATGGLTSVAPSVLSYSFNDGRSTLTEANSELQAFEIAIDGSGDVSEWRIIVQQPFPGTFQQGDVRRTILTQSFSGSNPDDSGEIDVCLVNGCSSQGIDWGRAFGNPGTWSVVPVPAAGILFLTALIPGFALARRRR